MIEDSIFFIGSIISVYIGLMIGKFVRKVFKANNINKMMKLNCKRCGYTWNSHKDNPLCCPKCKRYDYKKERYKKVIGDGKS